MWYKEWRTGRYKLWLAGTVYGLAGLLSVAAWSSAYLTTLIEVWASVSLVATGFLGVLNGLDLVSQERDQQTITFLLTRPISRARIYTVKILFSAGSLALVYTLASLIMLALAYLPLTYDYWNTELQRYVYHQPTHVMPLSQALPSLWLVGLVGISLVCFTGLISVFSRTVVHTVIGFVVFGLMVLAVGALAVSILTSGTFKSIYHADEAPFLGLGLLVISYGLYRGGRAVLERQEF